MCWHLIPTQQDSIKKEKKLILNWRPCIMLRGEWFLKMPIFYNFSSTIKSAWNNKTMMI